MYEIFARLLKEKGVKVFDVAKATGLRSSLFTDWKMGRYKPKAEKRRIIADYFGVTLDYLDGISDRPHGDFTNAKPVSSVEMISIPVLKEIPNGIDVAAVTSTNGNIIS